MIVKINAQAISNFFPVTAQYNQIDKIHKLPHTGIDLGIPYGTDILSPVNGVVSKVVDYGAENIGKGIFVRLQDGNELILGHLSKINVKEGQVVKVGQKLADSGNSGFSSGSHLHLGLQNADGTAFLDPTTYEQTFQKINDHHGFLHNILSGKGVVTNALSVPNPFKQLSDQLAPIANFFNWCSNVVHDMKTMGGHVWIQHQLLWLSKQIILTLMEINDLVFLLPGVILFALTVLIGRNKYSRLTIPALFLYAVTEILKKVI